MRGFVAEAPRSAWLSRPPRATWPGRSGVLSGGVSSIGLVPPSIASRFEVHEWRNAAAVLSQVYPDEWADIVDVLDSFVLLRSEIESPGKNKSKIALRLDGPLTSRGWVERHFSTEIVVDGASTPSPTHKVDCFRNGVALEVEWNNKDPFYDRDLNNFRLLFELRAIGVGVMVTRSSELQVIFDHLGKGKSYGNSTTHMGKWLPKAEGGGGGGCPILAFGITNACYVDDVDGSTSFPSSVV